jgi:hypothetical protein
MLLPRATTLAKGGWEAGVWRHTNAAANLIEPKPRNLARNRKFESSSPPSKRVMQTIGSAAMEPSPKLQLLEVGR